MNKVIIANWKTYLKNNEALDLASKLSGIENLIIAPSTPHLGLIKHNVPSLSLASQDVSAISSKYGTNTGEIPARMIYDMDIKYSMIGHSERRINNLEDNSNIALKVHNVLSENLIPIICVGETISDRKSGKYKDVIANQLLSLKLSESTNRHLSKLATEEQVLGAYGAQNRSVHMVREDSSTGVTKQLPSEVEFGKMSNVIIAYEPVWAIGTGVVPSSDEIAEVMLFIKSTLKIAGKLILVYGGSVNSQNAKLISKISYVDGLLIGKASTELDHINEIIRQIC